MPTNAVSPYLMEPRTRHVVKCRDGEERLHILKANICICNKYIHMPMCVCVCMCGHSHQRLQAHQQPSKKGTRKTKGKEVSIRRKEGRKEAGRKEQVGQGSLQGLHPLGELIDELEHEATLVL